MHFTNYFISTDSIHNIGICQSIKGGLHAVWCNTTQYGLRSIHYCGVRLWNSIPNEIKDSHSLSSFQHKSTDYYLSNYKLSLFKFFMICLSIHHLQSTKTKFVLFVLFVLFTDSNDFDSFLMLQYVFMHMCEIVCCFLGQCQIK